MKKNAPQSNRFLILLILICWGIGCDGEAETPDVDASAADVAANTDADEPDGDVSGEDADTEVDEVECHTLDGQHGSCQMAPNCAPVEGVVISGNFAVNDDGECELISDEEERRYFCVDEADGDDAPGFHGRQLDDGSWEFVRFGFRGRADDFQFMNESSCVTHVSDPQEQDLCIACSKRFNVL